MAHKLADIKAGDKFTVEFTADRNQSKTHCVRTTSSNFLGNCMERDGLIKIISIESPIRVGDTVEYYSGTWAYTYEVMAIVGESAWLKNLTTEIQFIDLAGNYRRKQ